MQDNLGYTSIPTSFLLATITMSSPQQFLGSENSATLLWCLMWQQNCCQMTRKVVNKPTDSSYTVEIDHRHVIFSHGSCHCILNLALPKKALIGLKTYKQVKAFSALQQNDYNLQPVLSLALTQGCGDKVCNATVNLYFMYP